MPGRREWSIDHHEVTEMTAELESAPARVSNNLDQVFANEADALWRDMKRDASGHRYLPDTTKSGQANFARNLVQEKLGALDHEIGFRTRKAASIAHIIAFGSVNNAPVFNFYGPITRRAVPFVEHVARIAEDKVFTTKGFR